MPRTSSSRSASIAPCLNPGGLRRRPNNLTCFKLQLVDKYSSLSRIVLMVRQHNQLRQSSVGSLSRVEWWQAHVLEDVANLDRNIVALDEFLNKGRGQQSTQVVGWLSFLEINKEYLVVRNVRALSQQRHFAGTCYSRLEASRLLCPNNLIGCERVGADIVDRIEWSVASFSCAKSTVCGANFYTSRNKSLFLDKMYPYGTQHLHVPPV